MIYVLILVLNIRGQSILEIEQFETMNTCQDVLREFLEEPFELVSGRCVGVNK